MTAEEEKKVADFKIWARDRILGTEASLAETEHELEQLKEFYAELKEENERLKAQSEAYRLQKTGEIVEAYFGQITDFDVFGGFLNAYIGECFQFATDPHKGYPV